MDNEEIIKLKNTDKIFEIKNIYNDSLKYVQEELLESLVKHLEKINATSSKNRVIV